MVRRCVAQLLWQSNPRPGPESSLARGCPRVRVLWLTQFSEAAVGRGLGSLESASLKVFMCMSNKRCPLVCTLE